MKKIITSLSAFFMAVTMVSISYEEVFAYDIYDVNEEYVVSEAYGTYYQFEEMSHQALNEISLIPVTNNNGFTFFNVRNEAEFRWAIDNKLDHGVDIIQLHDSITIYNPVVIDNITIVIWGNSNSGLNIYAPNGGFVVEAGGNLSLVSVNLQGGNEIGPIASNGTGVVVRNGALALRTNTIIEGYTNSGVRVYNGSLLIGNENVNYNNATIQNNSSAEGGGIFVESGLVTVRGGNIINNTASQSGGGIFASNSNVTFYSGTVSGNIATTNGNGISNQGGIITIFGGSILDAIQ